MKLIQKKLVANDRSPIGSSYWFWCPACLELHRFTNRIDGGSPSWTFDGNFEKPTFNPSLRYLQPEHKHKNDEGVEETIPEKTLCYLFLHNGVLEYCTDNPHKLNGQTIALPDIPEDSWVLKFGE